MSLPPTFTKPEEYFEECMKFLLQYRELYWKSNVEVLNNDLSFHVNLKEESEKVNVKEYSELFFGELERLAPVYEILQANTSDTSEETERVKSPMSQKKAHEVVHLTKEIKNVCHNVGCQTVVDLGAGLGYIDLQIFAKTGLNVLGLEGKESFYVTAKAHQRKYHSESLERVKYMRHIVTEESNTKISTFLTDKFPNNKEFCFMGLHACGDLTVSAMNLFLKMPDSRALVVTPCCYHKMVVETDNKCRFKYFPLSATFRKIYERFDGHTFLNLPFLRVAAQPSHMRNENMQDRVFCLLARALLNVFAAKYNCKVEKKKRKAARVALSNDFTNYTQEAITKSFKLRPLQHTNLEENTIEFDIKELQSLWDAIPKSTFENAALYIAFQNKMPPVFENLILYDRLVYLKENGVNSCYFKKVVNEKISPKCLSLFANKGG